MRRSVIKRYVGYIAIGILIIVACIYMRSSGPLKAQDETNCTYVSSRGILKSCDIYSSKPVSSTSTLDGYDFSKVVDGSIVYVASSAIPAFIERLASIPHKIVLVSGDADQSVPDDAFKSSEEFRKFIEDDRIIHWFSQNSTKRHEKLTPIPIGLDYHSMAEKNHIWGSKMSPVGQEAELLRISGAAAPFYERKPICYSNFHFNYKGSKFGSDRADAIREIPADLIYYEPKQVGRAATWKAMADYAFVASPAGNGLDCHRTWEALCLGCIAVVKTSPLDSLYMDLPVLIVESWSDITQTKLENTIREFRLKTFNYDRLLLSYWMDTIRGAAKA